MCVTLLGDAVRCLGLELVLGPPRVWRRILIARRGLAMLVHQDKPRSEAELA
jgi:hypothetical protein